MIEVLPKPSDRIIGNGDEICHYYCGNTYPNKQGTVIAFCGMDVTDQMDDEEDESKPCSMCIEDCNPNGACPICGSWGNC